MERAILKLARQLKAYDEASLMALWEKYAEKVQSFEPSERWEEAVLVLSMIQGVRFKNQLFNYNWAESRKPEEPSFPGLDGEFGVHPDYLHIADPKSAGGANGSLESGPVDGKGLHKRGKLLSFSPRED